MRGKPNPFISSEFVLLGLLYEKPTHGYELHKKLTDPDGVGMIWNVKMSNLYAQLDKLAQSGYITGTVQPGETHPNRTEYHITPEGKTALIAWLETTVKHPRDFRQEFMARYYYLIKYFPSKAHDLCQTQLKECRDWLKNTLASQKEMGENMPFKAAVIGFRVNQIQAIIAWLEKH